jgi:hypothetical protein
MPIYTFKNLETNEEYDEVMSYEKLQEYLKQDNIQQVFNSDGGGMKDQFTDWCKESSVNGKGDFKPYGKAAKGMKQKGDK